MNFNFGEVLTRAWQIVWKHRVLWIFGVLASCGRSGGGGNGGGGSSNYSTSGPSSTDLPPQVLQMFRTIAENITQYVIIGVALVCLVWIIVIFLSTIGKIGLIRGTAQVEGGAEALVFGQLFSESTPYFWRMFGLSLILGLPVIILVMVALALVFGGILAASGGDGSGIAILGMLPVLFGCVCLFIPVMFVLGMIFRQAERGIVLENMGVIPSISHGWEVFRKNLGPVILMAIILAIITLIVGAIIAIPIIAVVFPAAFAFALGEARNFTPLILMGVCLCLYVPVAWLANGIVIAYVESAWTLTYMRLTGTPAQDNAPIALEENA